MTVNEKVEKKLLYIALIVLFILSSTLSYIVYKNKKIEKEFIINKTLVEYLQKENKRNQEKRDSINKLLILNLKKEDEKILDIIDLPDSTKVRLLSERYNFAY